MARTKFTVSFPAAKAGDVVTWPNSVQVYADANIDHPLGNGYIEVAGGSFTGWSTAASVTFTRAGTSDAVTVTSGSPTGTGDAAASPGTGGSSPVYTFTSVVPVNNNVDTSADELIAIEWDPAWTRQSGTGLTLRSDHSTFDVDETGLYHTTFYNSIDAISDTTIDLMFLVQGGIYPGADGGGTWNDPGSQFQDNGAGSVIWQNEWLRPFVISKAAHGQDTECMLDFPNQPLRLLAGTSFRFMSTTQIMSGYTGSAALVINPSTAVSINRLA